MLIDRSIGVAWQTEFANRYELKLVSLARESRVTIDFIC
jgi:hypothetical protein